MNRMHLPNEATPWELDQSSFATSTLSPLVGGSSCLAYFCPLHYEPNYAYPLVVWLHGCGGDETQLRRIMPHVSLRNYVAVAPRGTLPLDEDDPQAGYGWVQDADHILLAEQRIADAVERAGARFHVGPRKIFVAGYASGATMALRFAMEHPDTVAGALAIGGAFPSGFAPLRRVVQSRNVPLLLASGRDSVDYPPAQVCDDLRLLHAAGNNVSLRHYPCGDELTTQMLSDMDRWIMEQLGCVTDARDDRIDCTELN